MGFTIRQPSATGLRIVISLDFNKNKPVEATNFEQAFVQWNWKPIRNCPGRFIFAEGRSRLIAEEIAGIKIKTYEFRSEKVPDKVLVAKFNTGGGLISYLKEVGKSES